MSETFWEAKDGTTLTQFARSAAYDDRRGVQVTGSVLGAGRRPEGYCVMSVPTAVAMARAILLRFEPTALQSRSDATGFLIGLGLGAELAKRAQEPPSTAGGTA